MKFDINENGILKKVILAESDNNIIIPFGVKVIDNNAFSDCIDIETIELPDSVTRIGYLAFYSCKKLKNIKLSKNLEQIGEGAFLKCESLEEIILPKKLKKIPFRLFKDCINLHKIEFLCDIERIEEEAFEGCQSLKKLQLPNSLKKIKSKAFKNCINMDNIYLGESIETISTSAFINCKNIRNLEFFDSINHIQSFAFLFCDRIEKIKLGNGYKTIDTDAFSKKCIKEIHLSNLSDIFLPGIVTLLPKINYFYINKKNNSLLLLSEEESIMDYEKINYIDLQDKYGFDTSEAVITSLLISKDELKNTYFPLFLTHVLRLLVNNDNYLKISEILKYNKEFTNFLKRLLKDNKEVDAINLYETFKLAVSLGAFNEEYLDRQKACEFLSNCFDKKILVLDKMHGSFDSFSLNLEFNKEWAKFFMNKKNLESLYEVEKNQTGYIARIYNDFDDIKEFGKSNRGNQKSRKITIQMCEEYFSKKTFVGIDDTNYDISRIISKYTRNQVAFDDAREIRTEYLQLEKKGEIKEHILNIALCEKTLSTIEKSISKKINEENKNTNEFSYDFLSKKDPENFILGKYCSCCAHLEGAGFSIMKASILHPNCQNLVIKDNKGKIIAKSTLYINRTEGYGVFNNVEINHNITNDEKEFIYKAYIRAINRFVEEYNKEFVYQPLKKINVGMGLNDLKDIIMKNHEESKLLTGLNFSAFGTMEHAHQGDWQKSQYTIWKK